MFLFEMFPTQNQKFEDSQSQTDFRFSPGEDNSALKINDTRKTRLTLKQIQKLRLMNELRAIEAVQKLKKIRKIYAAPAQAPGL